MAERVGFEPTDAFTSPVFKTGSLNRSDISPNRFQAQIEYYHTQTLLSTKTSKKAPEKKFKKIEKKAKNFSKTYCIFDFNVL